MDHTLHPAKPVRVSAWTALLYCFYTFSMTQLVSSTLHNTSFVKAWWCPDQALNSSLHYDSQRARSSVECIVRCASNPGCVTADFDVTNRTCYLSGDSALRDCSNVETIPGVKHYQRKDANPCKNNGSVDSEGNCVCPEPYCGVACGEIMQDCVDVLVCGSQPLKPAKAHLVWPATSTSPFYVLCYSITERVVRTHIALRTSPAVDFNRPWVDYKNGFADAPMDTNFDNHWLGLEKIHRLTTNMNYELRVVIKIVNTSTFYGMYKGFVVNGEADGYSLNISTVEATELLDCLSPLEGAGFSTYDNDHDSATSVNCAQRHGGGWWYKGKDCSVVCNPFGRLLQPEDDARNGVPDEVFWSIKHVGDIAPNSLALFLLRI